MADLIETSIVISQDTQYGEREFPGALLYDPGNPYAVSLYLEPPGQEPLTWLLSRELLVAGNGSHMPLGEGDVHLGLCEPDKLHIELSSDGGDALIHLSPTVVHEFLQETFKEVPLGEEMAESDVDELIKEILGS